MRFRKDTPDLQFFSDDQRLVCPDNFQFADSSGLSPLCRYQVDDASVVAFRVPADQRSQFFLRVAHFPPVEIVGLLVVVVQYLCDDPAVMRVAERFGSASDPVFRFLFIGKVGQV